MLFKFFILKEKEFFKKNYYYFLFFFIMEFFLGFSIYYTNSSIDIIASMLGYINNDTNNLLININKLFVVFFYIFILLRNNEHSLQFSRSCFTGRIKTKIFLINLYIFNFFILLLMNSMLMIMAFLIIKIESLEFMFNVTNVIRIFNIHLIFSSLANFIFEKKHITFVSIFIIFLIFYLNDMFLNIFGLLLINGLIFILEINTQYKDY